MIKILLITVFLINTLNCSGPYSPKAYAAHDGTYYQTILQQTELISARYACKLPDRTENLYYLSSNNYLLSRDYFVDKCKRTFEVIDPKRASRMVMYMMSDGSTPPPPTNTPEQEALKNKQEHFFKKLSELRGSDPNADVIMLGKDMYADMGCNAEEIANEVINAPLPSTLEDGAFKVSSSLQDKELAKKVIELLRNKCNSLNTPIVREWKNIPGGLKQISVGYRKIVCGVNSNDHIYCRKSLDSDWFQLPGSLKQISVSKIDYTICGVNRHDEIYCREDLGREWQRVNGGLKWISVYSQGIYWGVNRHDQIWRSAKSSGVHPHWFHVEGALKQVSIGFNQQVCGVNAYDQIFCKTTPLGNWIHIPGGLKDVSVSAIDDSVCGVNSGDQIFCRNSILNSEWYNIPGGLKDLETYGQGEMWGVNRYDQIFTR